MVMNLPTKLRSAGRAPSLSYTLAFAQGLRKITENLSQGGFFKDEAQTALFKGPVRTAL
jgi:hypothetical protein